MNLITPSLAYTKFLAQYEELTISNVIKVMLRAEQLYQERESVTKILRQATEIDQLFQPYSTICRILSDNSASQMTDARLEHIWSFIRQISKALNEITLFQTQSLLYNTEFILNGEPLRRRLHLVGRVCLGYLLIKEE
jgi:hypothetical protein